MSDFIRCYDTVSMVLDEATSQFAPLFKENKDRRLALADICDTIDDLAEEFDAESIETEVDDVKMTVSIRLECSDMTLTTKDHKYYSLLKETTSFGFSTSETGNLIIEFVFPGIWDAA